MTASKSEHTADIMCAMQTARTESHVGYGKHDNIGLVRTDDFQRNAELENLLELINNSMEAAQLHMMEHYTPQGPDYPVVFLMGPLRSGTTLFMQWLATTGLIAYPTNMLARFYKAPVLGAYLQQVLTDPSYSFRDELNDLGGPINYKSANGKTSGSLSPNEFWYFWRRFLNLSETGYASDEMLFRSSNSCELVEELRALTQVFQKPFALKGMILNYNIPYLNSLFDKAIFVQIRRDYVTNTASVLRARERQLGDRKSWYSFKIPEYEELRKLDPVNQCAGQVISIDTAVSEGMATLDSSRSFTVQYEEFCSSPGIIYDRLMNKLGIDVKRLPYKGPSSFEISTSGHPDSDVEDAVARYLSAK